MTWESLQQLPITAVIQIIVLFFAFYYIFVFFRGTRGAQVLVGLAVSLFVLIALTQLLHLDALSWLLRRFTVYLSIAVLVIFQPEIRRALAELGKQPVFSMPVEQRSRIDNMVQAVLLLAEQKVGALIAVEREIGTRSIQESGVRLDARIAPELLATIFFPHTPLHDGGVIIQGNRIAAAACIFPLSQKLDLHKDLGTRHRAGVGISEETDAVVLVVSEETGTISVCYGGRLSRGLNEDKLRRFLTLLLLREKGGDSAWRRAKKQLDLTPEGIAKSETLAEQEKSRGE